MPRPKARGMETNMKTAIKITLACIFTGAVVCMVGMLYKLQQQEAIMEEKAQLIQQQKELQDKISNSRNQLDSTSAELKEAQEQLDILNTRISEAKSYRELLQQQLTDCEDLYQFDILSFVPNYDVKRFQASEFTSQISSNVFSGIFGSLIGGAVTAGSKDIQASMYSNRGNFNTEMMLWMQPAINGLGDAINTFDGSYEEYRELSLENDERQCIRNKMLLDQTKDGWQTALLSEEKEQLIDMMAKYRFRLNLFHTMYSMLLVDTAYLDELQGQLTAIDQLLAKYDPDTQRGYSAEEKTEALVSVMDIYTQAVKKMASTKPKDPAFPVIGGEFGSRRGEERGYYNEGGKKVYVRQNSFHVFFDLEGRPMFTSNSEGKKAYFYEGQVIIHDCETDADLESMINTANIIYEKFDEWWAN